MLIFDSVSKIYPGGVTSLDNVSFSVEPGEFVYITGHSGAGKSTLLRLIIRDFLPSQGKISFKDVDITTLGRKQLPFWRRQVGVVFQNYCLLPLKTAFENLAVSLRVSGKSEKEISLAIPALLETVGLQGREKAFPVELSGGEQQRLAVARAISHNPSLLIADEPAGNLDKKNTQSILDLFSTINRWGTTVLIATHDDSLVKNSKKRIMVLDRGKLIT